MRTLIAALAVLLVVGAAGFVSTGPSDAQDRDPRSRERPPRAPEAQPPRAPERMRMPGAPQGQAGTWQLLETRWGVLKINTATGETWLLREDDGERVYWGRIPHADEGRGPHDRPGRRMEGDDPDERREQSRRAALARRLEELRGELGRTENRKERAKLKRAIDALQKALRRGEREDRDGAEGSREKLRERADRVRERSELRRHADKLRNRHEDIEREIEKLRDRIHDEENKRKRRALERQIDELEEEFEEIEEKLGKIKRHSSRDRR